MVDAAYGPLGGFPLTGILMECRICERTVDFGSLRLLPQVQYGWLCAWCEAEFSDPANVIYWPGYYLTGRRRMTS